MSVVVRGWNPPKNCVECDFCYDLKTGKACKRIGFLEKSARDIYKERHENCPLEVIECPHGDLIDRSKLWLPLEDKGSRMAVWSAKVVVEGED